MSDCLKLKIPQNYSRTKAATTTSQTFRTFTLKLSIQYLQQVQVLLVLIHKVLVLQKQHFLQNQKKESREQKNVKGQKRL